MLHATVCRRPTRSPASRSTTQVHHCSAAAGCGGFHAGTRQPRQHAASGILQLPFGSQERGCSTLVTRSSPSMHACSRVLRTHRPLCRCLHAGHPACSQPSAGAGSTLNHWPFPERHLPEGYAYLLTHPGTPCVFWDHWVDSGALGQNVQALLRVRQSHNLHCRSKVRPWRETVLSEQCVLICDGMRVLGPLGQWRRPGAERAGPAQSAADAQPALPVHSAPCPICQQLTKASSETPACLAALCSRACRTSACAPTVSLS